MEDLEKLFKWLEIMYRLRDYTKYDNDDNGKLISKLSSEACIKILNLINNKIYDKGE